MHIHLNEEQYQDILQDWNCEIDVVDNIKIVRGISERTSDF
jgi:hypothetical protein